MVTQPKTYTTLAEFLAAHPNAVLPCTCDDPAVPFGHGHFMSCPKSKHFETYRRGHVDAYLLQLLQGPPRPCAGEGTTSCV